jgi:hypothetical protein
MSDLRQLIRRYRFKQLLGLPLSLNRSVIQVETDQLGDNREYRPVVMGFFESYSKIDLSRSSQPPRQNADSSCFGESASHASVNLQKK